MAIPILNFWQDYFDKDRHEGLGSSYERVVLNQKLENICQKYNASTILEAPCFGFTGLSGINSLYLAKNGRRITLVDHDKKRISMIRKVWEEVSLPVSAISVNSYSHLPFESGSFDVSWNFSSLWFVEDLEQFLFELNRLTLRAIILCVPNRAGIGYLSQKYLGRDDLKKYLKEEHIIPANFIKHLKSLGWKLVDHDFIDAPPWPDIGMSKEKFLHKIGLDFLLSKEKTNSNSLTIMDYYNSKNPDFAQQMLSYFWFEKHAPWIIKRFWAHHRYFIFERD